MSTKITEPKRICAAYIRVSTHDQEEYSPESQKKKIKEYARQHNMILPEEFIYQDDGISGRKVKKRTAFQDMISQAKSDPQPFSVILVWKFSRFARNQEESIVYKSMLRKKCGVEVISISEPIIDGPFGSLIERIIEWQDEYYSINLGTEVRRGMVERASRGEAVSTAPLGYKFENRQLVVVPEEAEVVRKIYADFLSGTAMISIAKKLNYMGIKTKRGNTFENRTVRYILTNPIYIGKVRWCKNGVNDYHKSSILEGTMFIDGIHEHIISETDFDRAQELLAEYNSKYIGTGNRAQRQIVSHMLQGLVRCDTCGKTLSYSRGGYNCSAYVHGKCTVSHYITAERLERWVLDSLEAQMGSLSFEITPRKKEALTVEKQQINALLKKEKEILRRHKEAYAAGVDTLEEYTANKQESAKRIKDLTDRLDDKEPPMISKEEFAKKYSQLIPVLRSDKISAQEKNNLLRSFVDHVTFHKDTKSVSITYYS